MQEFFDQPADFSGFGVPAGLEFGVNQPIVDDNFEFAAVRWNQSERFDFRFVFLEQFACQAHGPVGVMSNSAISQFDFEHWFHSRARDYVNYNMAGLTLDQNSDRLCVRSSLNDKRGLSPAIAAFARPKPAKTPEHLKKLHLESLVMAGRF